MENQSRPNCNMLRWFNADLLNTKDAARASEAPRAYKYPFV
jgi:hypothetical protein